MEKFKGFDIKETTDPWAIKYGYKYEYFRNEKVHHAKTLEDAIEQINEITCNENSND